MYTYAEKKKWNVTLYSQYMGQGGNPIDELGIIVAALTIHQHVAVLLRGFQWWTTREDGDWSKCQILFTYTGTMTFVPIRQINCHNLNKISDQVSRKRMSTKLSQKWKLNDVECQVAGEPNCVVIKTFPPQKRTCVMKNDVAAAPMRRIRVRASKTKGKKLLKVMLGMKQKSPKKSPQNKMKKRG